MNTNRIFAIPDIHGRFDLLEALLTRLETHEKLDLDHDKLIFLGDMVDRGPDSRQVVRLIKNLVTKRPGRVIALAGNHEWLMIDAISKSDNYLWLVNGGDATLRSYYYNQEDLESHVRWLAQLPFCHEEPGFFFSHAPCPREEDRSPTNKGQPFTKYELTWTYESLEGKRARDHGNGVVGVCGHVHALRNRVMEPRFYPHYIFADAGCGCSDKAPLVAIEVKSRKVIYAHPIEAQETRSL